MTPMRTTRAVTALAVIMLTMTPACGGETDMQASSIQAVKKSHEAELLSVPGVVSVGIGRDDEGRAVIVVGLDRERPEARQQLPGRLDGYDVRAEVVGKVKASAPDSDRRRR